jgi:murein DD-endopeptidase MepM/ murein hydrolase activator NlpD
MFRPRVPAVLVLLALLVATPAWSSDQAVAGSLSLAVASPHRLDVRNRAWDGNLHGMPSGRGVLEYEDGQRLWELEGVTQTAVSADGSTAALLTRDYEVFVSRLPEPPRRIAGGPYLGPALSGDGRLLLAQRLGTEGHILNQTFNTRGIALVDLESGEDRLLLEGNDLYAPSFASEDLVFFGWGGRDGTASLYLLDLASQTVARVTNRRKAVRQTFPSETPLLVDGTVVYRADDEEFRVPAPRAEDFGPPVKRFDRPQIVDNEPISPNFGTVKLRRPNTQANVPPIHFYFDLNPNANQVKDWSCAVLTYDRHEGTDINQSMGFNVVAPALGKVVMRNDGCANQNSQGCGGGFGNYVGLKHMDGGISIEAHGMNGTVVELGARQACGSVIMKSASSGNSQSPHIHHESWKDQFSQNKKYDPYRGSCDNNDPTKWGSQGPYLGLPGANCVN